MITNSQIILKDEKLFEFYDLLNKDTSHMNSSDDICTPIECVKTDRLYSRKLLEKEYKSFRPLCWNR